MEPTRTSRTIALALLILAVAGAPPALAQRAATVGTTSTSSTGAASTDTSSTGTSSTGSASTGSASTGSASTGTASTGTASTGTSTVATSDPFDLRRRLRSSDAAIRRAATRTVLASPARYLPATTRIALANAARDLDAANHMAIATLLATTTNDDTTRAAAALTIGRIDELRARAGITGADWGIALANAYLGECLVTASYPTNVRRACAEAAGIGRLVDQRDALRAVALRTGEDPLVALAAERSYTRIARGALPRGPASRTDVTTTTTTSASR